MPVPRTEVTIYHQGALLLQRILTPGQYVVGSDSAHLRVDHPDISAHHASLSLQAHLLTVEDVGSTGGIFIDDRRVESPTRLFPNQKLVLSPGLELFASRIRDEEDPEASCSIQQAYVDRLLPLEFRQSLKYEVQQEAGRGGMGTVFRVREMSIRRAVAMKVMRAQPNEEAVARFIGEAQITGQLEHPNIVPVHELGVDEQDQLFYTMKYVRGDTLKEVLARMAAGDEATLQKFPLSQLLTTFEKVCDAMAFAHSRRVIHRDLKPENIMIGEFGEVLVMDWGLAVLLPEENAASTAETSSPTVSLGPQAPTDSRRKTGEALAGTPQYMAPEQARGETATLDASCDIYALGAMLYSILYLNAPIPGERVQEVLENVRTGRTRLAAGLLPDKPLPHCPPQGPPVSLVAVARKAMALLPQDRYASVTELQAELRTYFAGFATRAEQAGIGRQFLLLLARYKREAILLGTSAIILAAVGTTAVVRVVQERRRAESALATLRSKAPEFIRQADLLAQKQNFDDALEKIDYALELQPEAADAHLLKGDLLQAKLRLKDAAVSYRKAEEFAPGRYRARANAELCERLAGQEAPDGTFPQQALGELYESMVAERRPAALMLPLAQLIGRENEFTRQFWLERLDQLTSTPDRPWEVRFHVRPDGQLTLDLSDTPVSDLSPLVGMPIAQLKLSNCHHIRDLSPLQSLPLQLLELDGTSVSDLSPLQGMKLEELSIANSRVQDLSPLAGSTLRRFDCSKTAVTDFSALTQTRLDTLSLSATPVTDLGFLRGLPLRVLRLEECHMAKGYAVLYELPTLEVLSLPKTFHTLPADEISAIAALQGLPQLRQIFTQALPDSRLGEEETSAEFWKKWGPDLAWIAVVRRSPTGEAELLADGSWSVKLHDHAVTDLGFLSGARITRLDLFGTSVSDLRPISGLPLEAIDLRCTKVTDLTPLRGLALKELMLWQNPIEDFSPLSSMPQLEILDLTETPFSDLRLLKTSHLKLLRLGHTRVTDLSPLAGMTLEKLHCDAVDVASVEPLLECKGLRWLIVPSQPRPADLEKLKDHPTLERLSFGWTNESYPDLSAAEFWKARDEEKRPPP